MWKVVLCCLVLLGLIVTDLRLALANTSTFTYQGMLHDGSNPANGNYDLQFRLFDALADGGQVGSTTVVEDVSVAAGVFSVALDFGLTAFPGADRFLEIAVRPGASSGSFTTLTPRQAITATPYAINATRLNGLAASDYVLTGDTRLTDARAPTAGSSHYIQNTDTPQSGSKFNISGNGVVGGNLTVSGTLNGSGANLTGLNASNIATGTLDTARVTVPFILNGPINETSAIITGRNYADFGVGVFGDAHGSQAYGVWGVAQGVGYGVQGESANGIGIRGNSVNGTAIVGYTLSGTTGISGGSGLTSGTSYGVYGYSVSSSGTGVRGAANSASGSTFGVVGHNLSDAGRGVRGEAYANSGPTVGVEGESTSTSGIGVRGYASSSSGITYGVLGENLSSSGMGVRGYVSSLTGATTGVYGFSKSNDGKGVVGFVDSLSGNTWAVYGQTNSTTGVGVKGFAINASGSSYGVQGSSASSSGIGVWGSSFQGVRGETVHGTGFGVVGVNTAGGSSISWGVYGQNTSSGGYGVEGYNPNGIGVRGNGGVYAGQFIGNVQVLGTLSKSAGSFQIDHPLDPENMYLNHSFVESPDMKNIYDGVAELDTNGEAWVQLPDYFEALNRDFRYQLTAIGAAAPYLHVAHPVEDNRFLIAGGTPGQQVSWQVTGTRQDAYAVAHRIQVEVPKSASEKGKYQYPELFDQPESRAVIPRSQPLPSTYQPVSTQRQE